MRPDDLYALEELHRAQGFAYEMPDLADPLYFIKLVDEENGKIVTAGIAHLTAEIFFLADTRTGTPRQRFARFLAMEKAGSEAAYRQGGLSDIHAWLPPEIAKPFGRRLLKLGWKRPLWASFAKELGK
jgi:hypothetical protein